MEENQIVKEIHDTIFSMDSITDNYIQTTLKRIYKKENVERINKLSKLGFINTISVKESEEANRKELEEINDAMNEYAILYPNSKFILDKDIFKVCKKYGLVLTSPDRFIGEIPIKNQEDIATFRSKHTDNFVFLPNDLSIEVFNTVRDINRFGAQRFSSFDLRMFTTLVSLTHNFLKNTPEYALNKAYDTRQVDLFLERYKEEIHPMLFTFESNLFIASTPSLVNLENCIVNDKQIVTLDYKKYEPVLLPNPDPIVFCKVPKGAIIVTAWGPEASDTLIVNEKMN